jgi:AcrR family transcriptional regulator
MHDRLTKSDWIRHGLRTLAKDGPNALKVGPMSTKLKVSRGSFYWHFRDIADFRSQLLRSWQERSTDQVIQDLDAREAEPDRLKHLMRRAFGGTRNLDRAIRSWAAEDEDVARIVASVDGRRVARIRKIAGRGGRGRRAGAPSGRLPLLGLSRPGRCHGSSPFIHIGRSLGRYQRPV